MSTEPRRRFIASRVVLRRVLAAYSPVPANRIDFSYGPHGKPHLAGDLAGCGLHFNISHSKDRALFAISRSPVGIDIQAKRMIKDMDALATRYFAAGEVRALRRTPAPKRQDAFFAGWTRKEAYLKAVGGGISLGLDSFEVAIEPHLDAALIRSNGNHDPKWVIRDLEPARGMVGAIAIQNPNCKLCCWQIEPAQAPALGSQP